MDERTIPRVNSSPGFQDASIDRWREFTGEADSYWQGVPAYARHIPMIKLTN